jgi:phosphoribosylanthranilate isomerase
MFVKICGIRNEKDLTVAINSGTDAVGFICGTTAIAEDHIDLSTLANLVTLTPLKILTVLVTHLIEPEEIIPMVYEGKVKAIQIQGAMTVENMKIMRQLLPISILIKAFHVFDGQPVQFLIETITPYLPSTDAIVLDSRTKERLGGTGIPHDWNISNQICALMPLPVILAGGLQPANIRNAIETVHPAGVDANSGLEDSQGNKDGDKCRAFVTVARALECTT